MSDSVERLQSVDASWSDVGETCAEAAETILALRKALADGAKERTEVLWINPAAHEAISAGPLFEVAA